MNRPVQYLIANKALGMSPGKLAAQVAHAAVRSAMASGAIDVDKWLKNGETKIVLEARDAEHLLMAEHYINNRGFRTFRVIDEGRTEVPPLSATVLGVELVDKVDPYVQQTFETFRTYREEPKPVPIPYYELDAPPQRNGTFDRLLRRGV